jgi:hypothetical protein
MGCAYQMPKPNTSTRQLSLSLSLALVLRLLCMREPLKPVLHVHRELCRHRAGVEVLREDGISGFKLLSIRLRGSLSDSKSCLACHASPSPSQR